MNKGQDIKKEAEIEEQIDKQMDIATAVDIARDWIRKNFGGNLNYLQYKLENVRENGSKTRYIVIVSIVPDIGEEREFYLIRVDIEDGKVVPPFGKGKLNQDGKIDFQEIPIEKKFKE